MVPPVPQWVARANEWATLGQWTWAGAASVGALFGLGAVAAAWIEPINALGWGAWVWCGALFAAVVSLSAALCAHAYAIISGRGGVHLAHIPFSDSPPPSKRGIESARSDPPKSNSNNGVRLVERPELAAAKHDLAMFVTSRLLPAYHAQRTLQFVILKRICGANKALLEMADLGSCEFYSLGKFHEAAGKLRVENSASRIRIMRLEELEELVDIMRQYYGSYCTIPDALCGVSGINYKSDPETAPFWQDWRHQQIFLVSGYEIVRNDYRLDKVYRPNGGDEFGSVPSEEA